MTIILALDVYEPRMASIVDLFLSRLALHEGVPVDVTRLCGFLGFDIMGDVGQSPSRSANSILVVLNYVQGFPKTFNY